MKKTYINPELNVINVHTQQMIADSQAGIGQGTKDGGSAASRRRRNDWDDEEEEDEENY
ncbi:MAG: hypothetical protein J6Z14_03245 [Prevotella sp.]|nr:hypothetical protein [Prevotella sp.]